MLCTSGISIFRCILIILAFQVSNAHCESPFDMLIPQPGIEDDLFPTDRITFGTLYYHAYQFDRPTEPDDRISLTVNHFSFSRTVGELSFEGKYRDDQYYGSFKLDDALKNIDCDYSTRRFDLSCMERFNPISVTEKLIFSELPGASIGINFRGESFSIENTTSLYGEKLLAECQVLDTYSKIPLSTYLISNSTIFVIDPFSLLASFTVPCMTLRTKPFQLEPEGYKIEGLCSLDIEPWLVEAYCLFSDLSASLFYNDSLYGEINNLSFLSLYVNLTYIFDDAFSIRAGVSSLDIGIGEGSFVSSTPFYASAGLYPNKYRIDDLSTLFLSPYVGVKAVIELPSLLELEILCDYYYLNMSIDYRYSEREYLVFPFLFKYTPHEGSITIPIDSLFRLQGRLGFFLSKNTILSFYLFVLVPFSIHNIFSTTPGDSNGNGGTPASIPQGQLSGGFAFFIGLTFLL